MVLFDYFSRTEVRINDSFEFVCELIYTVIFRSRGTEYKFKIHDALEAGILRPEDRKLKDLGEEQEDHVLRS